MCKTTGSLAVNWNSSKNYKIGLENESNIHLAQWACQWMMEWDPIAISTSSPYKLFLSLSSLWISRLNQLNFWLTRKDIAIKLKRTLFFMYASLRMCVCKFAFHLENGCHRLIVETLFIHNFFIGLYLFRYICFIFFWFRQLIIEKVPEGPIKWKECDLMLSKYHETKSMGCDDACNPIPSKSKNSSSLKRHFIYWIIEITDIKTKTHITKSHYGRIRCGK